MIPHDLPDYVERGGRQVWRPPYRARGGEVYGFVIDADKKAIDVILQRDLVEPGHGAVDVRSAHGSVMVLFATMGSLTSAKDPDRLRGTIPELEVSVWCLGADVAAKGRLLWYLPYVFTDSGQTVASGREVYGYPKQIGYFDQSFHSVLATSGATTVEALTIDPFAPASVAQRRPVFRAERTGTGGKSNGIISSGGLAFGNLASLLGNGIAVNLTLPFGPKPKVSASITPLGSPAPSPKPVAPPWLVKRVLSKLTGAALTGDPSELVAEMIEDPKLIFLKQFRDVSCPTKACYQAIVEAPLSVDPLGAVYEQLDPSLFKLTVSDWDSHPIASDLGVVAGQPITPQLAFHAKFDFDIQLGTEIYRAPT